MKLHSSVRRKFLTLITVIVSIANVGVGIIAIKSAEKGLNYSTQITMDTVSANVVNQINDLIEQEFTLIKGLTHLPDILDSNKTLQEKVNFLSQVKNIDPERYNNVGYCNAQGDSLVGPRIMNFSKNALYIELQTKDRYVSDPSPSTFTDGYLMYYSVPVKKDGKFDGAIMSVVQGNYLDFIAEGMEIGEGYHPLIINYKTKEVIGEKIKIDQKERTNIKDIDPNSVMADVYSGVLSGKTGYITYTDPETNIKMIASYKPVPNSAVTWAVFCAAPYDYYCGYMHKIHTNVVFCFVVALILTFLIGTLLIKMIIGPLLRVRTNMGEIATGNADLTQRITQTTYDEIGQLVENFNSFTGKMQTIVKDIQESNRYLGEVGEDLDASTEDTRNSINQIIENINDVHKQIDVQSSSVQQTAGAVNEIASNIESLEHMIENQTAGVEEASSAVEEMIGNINSVNDSVERMASSFENLISNAKEGSTIQSDVNQKISEIRSQSETLQEANLAIQAIAEQTNLLAMNAAIEAAHAGESGKGFSVVADEIRKLSETSSEQSKTIGTQLTNIQNAIIEVVNACNKSSIAFETMSEGISQTDEVVRQIKEAMDEQNEGSKQISQALHYMNDSTIEVRTSSKEMSEGNKSILEEVRNLQDATGVMKNSMSIMSNSARKINDTGIALTDISKKMRDSIAEISSQIEQFKV